MKKLLFYALLAANCSLFIVNCPSYAALRSSQNDQGQNNNSQGGQGNSGGGQTAASSDSARGSGRGGGNRGGKTDRGNSRSSEPAPAPQPQQIIINNNNVNTNTNTNTNVQSQTQAQTQTAVAQSTAVASARSYSYAASPRPSYSSVASAPVYVSPRQSWWEEGAYFGIDLQIVMTRLEERGAMPETVTPVGFGVDFSAGYKFPFARIGGEIGFMGGSEEFNDNSGNHEATDTFSVVTFMPHAFLELDNPSRVAPFVGFAAGLGIYTMKYEQYQGGSATSSISTTGGTFTYAAMLGLRIALSVDTELNMGYRYQDYGSVRLANNDNKLTGHSLNLGFAFKF